MGIIPAIASMPSTEDVLKALSIYMAALLCIFYKIFIWYDRGAWL